MWEARSAPLAQGRVQRFRIHGGEGPLPWQRIIALWRADASFAHWFSKQLAGARFEAFFWETPALTRADLGTSFEFVLVDSPTLAGVAPDAGAFADRFDRDKAVVGFENLGGDAYLLAPCPGERGQDFAHLAAFVRCATKAQTEALWHAVAVALEQRVGPRPLWCSTSGLGVFWLHIRLDSRPKYYTFDPYRRADPAIQKRPS